METLQKNIQVQTDCGEAISWLESEYPKGVDLVYVDYRDCYEDMANLQSVLKSGEENFDWQADSQYQSVDEIIKNYCREIEADEISEEVQETMRAWLFEHDTSDPVKELLKNTGRKLMFIETEDYTESYENVGVSEYERQTKRLQKKYAKTDEQKKEIEYVLGEQFYDSPVSFYFYADVLDVFNAIHTSRSKYIRIEGAYFSTIDRVQGSNWLGNKAVFTLTIPREKFIENFYLDEAKGTGYGWGQIAGQTEYDDAEIITTVTIKRGSIALGKVRTSPEQAREKKLQEHWDKTHKCVFGDMNWKRHTGKREYINSYPCGNKCEDCGTFWID